MDTKIDLKEQDADSDDVASQNKRDLFIRNITMKTNSDAVLLDYDCDMALKTKIKLESPFPDLCSWKERECCTEHFLKQSETIICSNNCNIDTKIKIGSQKEDEEGAVMKVKEYNSDHEMENKIEIKEEPWWLEREISSVCVDIKNEDFTPLKSPSFLLVLTVLTHNSSQYGTYLPLRTNGRQAVCVLQPATGSAVTGEIRLFQKTDSAPVEVMGHVQNLAPGAHGFHLHNEGSLADDCKGAGPHFNPLNQPHGGPQDLHRHAGDFGNILADENGQAIFHLMNEQVSLVPGTQFYGGGRAFVVHEKQDDLGRGGNPESLKTGNAGSRLACCVVQPVGY